MKINLSPFKGINGGSINIWNLENFNWLCFNIFTNLITLNRWILCLSLEFLQSEHLPHNARNTSILRWV